MAVTTHDNKQTISMALTMTLHQFKQKTDYDCAVPALGFFLFSIGYELPPNWYELFTFNLKPHPEFGTTTGNLMKFVINIRKAELPATPYIPSTRGWDKVKPPCMVIYQQDGEAHYGVVTRVDQKSISIFEPFEAKVVTMHRQDFTAVWRSKLNGNRWMLRV